MPDRILRLRLSTYLITTVLWKGGIIVKRTRPVLSTLLALFMPGVGEAKPSYCGVGLPRCNAESCVTFGWWDPITSVCKSGSLSGVGCGTG